MLNSDITSATAPDARHPVLPDAKAFFETPRHTDLRTAVRTFAETVVRPQVAAMESSQEVQVTLSREIARKGWIGVTIDETYGGMGLGHVAKSIIIEELARVSGAMGAMAQASQLGVAKIIHFGNEAQKRKWLPLVASGDCLPTIAVTENTSGSHVLGMSTTAVRDGDSYVLNGGKAHVGNSHVGDLHGVVARTGEGSGGLSAFLIESTAPGFALGPLEPTMGLHGFSFGELRFNNCRIPAENLLGSEGDGVPVAYSSSVLYGRLNLGAVSLGIHRAIQEQTARFATTHLRYGKSLSNLQLIRHKLGQIQSQYMTARLALYHAAFLLDHNYSCDAELMNAKLINVELALDSARQAMEIFAAFGLYKENEVERYVRDAFHIFSPAGTSDVQLQRLSEVALGISKGSWSEKLPQSFDA